MTPFVRDPLHSVKVAKWTKTRMMLGLVIIRFVAVTFSRIAKKWRERRSKIRTNLYILKKCFAVEHVLAV